MREFLSEMALVFGIALFLIVVLLLYSWNLDQLMILGMSVGEMIRLYWPALIGIAAALIAIVFIIARWRSKE